MLWIITHFPLYLEPSRSTIPFLVNCLKWYLTLSGVLFIISAILGILISGFECIIFNMSVWALSGFSCSFIWLLSGFFGGVLELFLCIDLVISSPNPSSKYFSETFSITLKAVTNEKSKTALPLPFSTNSFGRLELSIERETKQR